MPLTGLELSKTLTEVSALEKPARCTLTLTLSQSTMALHWLKEIIMSEGRQKKSQIISYEAQDPLVLNPLTRLFDYSYRDMRYSCIIQWNPNLKWCFSCSLNEWLQHLSLIRLCWSNIYTYQACMDIHCKQLLWNLDSQGSPFWSNIRSHLYCVSHKSSLSWSDKGSYVQYKAAKEIKRFLNLKATQESVSDFLSSQMITWKYVFLTVLMRSHHDSEEASEEGGVKLTF